MTAGKLDLTIEQGTTFRRELVWKDASNTPINLTGYSARMQVREHLSSQTAFLELSTSNSRISITAAQGKLVLEIPANITETLTHPTGVYDLELEAANGTVTRLLQGRVTIDRSITR